MKKIFPILLCVLLISVMALSVSAEGSNVSLAPSATTLERGDTFTIVANLTNTEAINLCTVALTFDTNVFELTGGVCHISETLFSGVTTTDKAGVFAFNPGVTKKVSGQVFTFNFKVKADAAFGTYDFTPTASIGENAQIPATGTTVTIACKHTYGDWTDLGNGKHQQVCSKCETPNVEDHDWNDGAENPAATCDTPGKMEFKCLFCAAPKTEDIKALGHQYDNACDATCNRPGCDHTRTTSHKYATAWSSDKTGHWHECTACKDKKDFAKHTPGPAATQDAAQTCTVCEFEIAPILEHEHEIGTIWQTNAEFHWHRCDKKSCQYTEDKAKHDYDDDCDVTCNTCGYARIAPHSYTGELQANAEGHWFVCTTCGEKSEVQAHEPGPEATETTKQVCVECNFTINLPLNHVHDFGDTWHSDEEHHWQSCTDPECYETTEMELHVWEEPEELADGNLQYTCSVCAAQVVTSEPMPDPTEPDPSVPDTTPGTQKPGNEEEKRFPWQWAGIAAIVLLIIGIVLLVIEFIRSRKVNSHGKFSK